MMRFGQEEEGEEEGAGGRAREEILGGSPCLLDPDSAEISG